MVGTVAASGQAFLPARFYKDFIAGAPVETVVPIAQDEDGRQRIFSFKPISPTS